MHITPAAGASKDVTALVPPLEQWRRFVYCETMTGDLLGTVDHFKARGRCAAAMRGLGLRVRPK